VRPVSNYLVIPINENGIIFDTDMNAVIAEAMAETPFNFRDIYIYSHGWSNDAARAMDEYNRFSIDFTSFVRRVINYDAGFFLDGPQDTLGVGIHWPSEITEDPGSELNKAQLFTFYTMEHRADAVGKNAVYSILRIMLAQRQGQGVAPRLHFIGHSFGCKVVLSALQDLKVDIDNGTIIVPPGSSFNVALLEPATDCDNLEPGDIYGLVSTIGNLRMLISISQCDTALVRWFHIAGSLANIVHKPLQGFGDLIAPGGPPQALGAVGPTAATITAFGNDYKKLDVNPGFSPTQMYQVQNRLIVADLTTVHKYRAARGLYNGGFAGSHSDINFFEVYSLIASFFFGVATDQPLPVTIAPPVPSSAPPTT
jgi:hypothetical protein